jgi:hypothetical protein
VTTEITHVTYVLSSNLTPDPGIDILDTVDQEYFLYIIISVILSNVFIFSMQFLMCNALIDINECQPSSLAPHHSHYAHNCHIDAHCINTKGSFYCACHTGYSGDGVTCIGGCCLNK